MADFVAVIRRAVDGLANNNPEMRIRVYEKARGAVQRQLENMKPRPSDEMLRRQMDKLEAAIREVEAEHREAAPAADAPDVPFEDAAPAVMAAAPAVAAWQEPAAEERAPEEVAEPPVPQQAAYYEPAPVAEPVQEEQYPADAEAHAEWAPEAVEPAYSAPQPVAEPEPAPHYAEEPITQASLPVEPEPAPYIDEPAPYAKAPQALEEHQDLTDLPADAPQTYAPRDENPFADDEPLATSQEVAAPVAAVEEPRFPAYDEPPRSRSQMAPAWPDAPSTAPSLETADPFASDLDDRHERPAEAGVREQASDPWSVTPASSHELDRAAEPVAEDSQRVADAAPASGWNPQTDWNTQPEWNAKADWQAPDEKPQDEPVAPASSTFNDRQAADLFDAHFDREAHARASVEMPAVADLPDYPATDKAVPPENDPLATYLQPVQTPARVEAPAKPNDPWNDLEQLIGYDKPASETGGRGEGLPPEETDLADAAPARAYRVQSKPKRNYGVLVLAVLGLAVLGGGGYAIWQNRDALDNIVGNVTGETAAPQTASAPPAAQTGTAPATTPQTGTNAATGAAGKPANGTAAGAAGAVTPEAAGPNKFTQRLLANGTEVDEGVGGPAVGSTSQSIAQLNAPAAAPEAGANTNAATAPAAPSSSAPAANPAATPAVSGEKIFLYEERIGQSSPTAIEGSVSWSLQSETGENGKPEPVVQGRINLPERGLTALVTFKRNADASLPASHLVEFVFSLPADFEGGAIESVQRISMKATEQDRGDPLIAVPAKITPDFHMIALNDFPDARARNMELLKSRNWLDVPIIYGTGRRALLTLQKGPEGVKAFDQAISEWAALAPSGQ
jgi:hypothetical protein